MVLTATPRQGGAAKGKTTGGKGSGGSETEESSGGEEASADEAGTCKVEGWGGGISPGRMSLEETVVTTDPVAARAAVAARIAETLARFEDDRGGDGDGDEDEFRARARRSSKTRRSKRRLAPSPAGRNPVRASESAPATTATSGGDAALRPSTKAEGHKRPPRATSHRRHHSPPRKSPFSDDLTPEQRRLAIKAVIKFQALVRGRSKRLQMAEMVGYLSLMKDVTKAVSTAKTTKKVSPHPSPRVSSPKKPARAMAPSAAPARKAAK